jgi:DNA-binding CsgD family transcriptional regulator
LGWHAAAALSPDLFVSFKRGTRFGPFEGADLTALDTVLPRLRTASRMASLTWRSEFAGQLTAFERTGCGALLLDLRARVLGMNACVQLGDGLDISNSTLDAPRSGDRLRLQKFLAAVMDGEASSTGSQTSTIALPRPSGLRPWLLDGIACTSALRSLHSEAVAMVLVTNLERPLHPATEVLHQLFGFTPAESRLARGLLSGESLKAAAARLSISEGHARQRLKSMFLKTATSRQSELILLLGRLG